MNSQPSLFGLEGTKSFSITTQNLKFAGLGNHIISEGTLRINDPSTCWETTGSAYISKKLDGIRIQIHFDGDQVFFYTRSGKNWAKKYLHLISKIKDYFQDHSLIIDVEIVIVSQSFEEIYSRSQTRHKNYNHQIVVFDLLYLDNKVWMAQPYQARRAALELLFASIERDSTIILSEEILATSDTMMASYYREWTSDPQIEGMIVKTPDAIYKPGKKSKNRIKIKPTDSVDLIIMGFFWATDGSIGSYLLGALEENGGYIVEVAKALNGNLSLSGRDELRLILDPIAINAIPISYRFARRPDVWVLPECVVEVDCYGLKPAKKSPIGIELEAARLTRNGLRDDKLAAEANSISEIKKLPWLSDFGEDINKIEEDKSQQLSLL